MGKYKNGKWVPTFGDDQFGVYSDKEYKKHRQEEQKKLDDNNAGEIGSGTMDEDSYHK